MSRRSLTFDKEHPEEGIAFAEDWFSGVLDRNGLQVESIRRGNWRAVRAYQISSDNAVAPSDHRANLSPGAAKPASRTSVAALACHDRGTHAAAILPQPAVE